MPTGRRHADGDEQQVDCRWSDGGKITTVDGQRVVGLSVAVRSGDDGYRHSTDNAPHDVMEFVQQFS